jgi:hypothetical protein
MSGLQFVERAIDLKPNDPDVLLLYAKMLLREKDVGLAEKKIQEAMQMIDKVGLRPK